MKQRQRFIIGAAIGCLLATDIGRVEAKEIPFKGDNAGTYLDTRIDLNNDGSPATWATWVEKSSLGQASVQAIIEQVPVSSPTGACPAGQLETALVGGSIVNTFLQTQDQLFIQPTSRVACIDPVKGTISGHTTATITGGTGKFAGATGSVTYSFTASSLAAVFDPESNQGFGPFTGTIEGTLILPNGGHDEKD